ncbi:MAG: TetR/AcrR family transcriptional regulator [Scytonema sp. RU_4_4]|nr:TetR/AcrR family transcriptional regulator [Scytonema sp. RU_4_4]
MTTAERLTRENWLEMGLHLLGAEGEKALTIERLCQVANRTKGSFYHHFKNRDEFINALLDYWQSEYTSRIISTVEQLDNLSDRRRELDRLAASIDNQIERAIRNWSSVDEQVKQVLKRVDEKRINYLAQLIAELVQLDEEMAFELAIVEYAVFVGVQHLFPNADAQWIERVFCRVTQMTALLSNQAQNV